MVTSETKTAPSHDWMVGVGVTTVAGGSVAVSVKTGVGVIVGACRVNWLMNVWTASVEIAEISTAVGVGVGVPVAASPQALSMKTAMIKAMARYGLCFFIFSFHGRYPPVYWTNRRTGSGCDAGLDGWGCGLPDPDAVGLLSGLSMLPWSGMPCKPILPDYSPLGFVRGIVPGCPAQILDSGGKSPIMQQVQAALPLQVGMRLASSWDYDISRVCKKGNPPG